MNFDLIIRYGKSTSHNYQKAIDLSKRLSNYQPISKENQLNTIIVNINELREKFKIFESLWLLISAWKTSEVILNDESINFNEIREIFKILECSKNYYKAIIPENHCKLYGDTEGWGCKYLVAVSRYLPQYSFNYERESYWYKFGHFVSETIWRIDKNKLKEAINREVELKKINLCEIFNFKKVENIIDNLPEQISLQDSDSWSIIYEESSDGSIIEQKPIGIIPKNLRKDIGFGYGIRVSLPDFISNNKKEVEETEKKSRYIPNISFSDIGGIDDIIEIIREIIELPLIKPDLFSFLNIKPHKGILLYGPPGCGKTMIAKAIANEIKAHFISIKGPELLNKYYGQSEENLRNIFHEGRELQPSIIYFDEIDSIAQKRSGEENLRFDARFVNQLLTLMDGIEDYGNICVIASTNRKELIDEALLRPGRFDYSIEIKKPTKEGCYQIFSISTKGMPIDEEFNIKAFSENLIGLSGAEISFIVREGAFNCLRRSFDLEKIIENQEFGNIDYKNILIKEDDFKLALMKIIKK